MYTERKGGAIPSEEKCPYGLRYRGHCYTSGGLPAQTTGTRPNDPEPDPDPEKRDPTWPDPYPVDLHLPVFLFVPREKVKTYKKVNGGFSQRNYAGGITRSAKPQRLSEPGRTMLENLNKGDELDLHRSRPANAFEKGRNVVDTHMGRLKWGIRASNALIAVDVATTLLENIQAGMDLYDALKSIPEQYVEAAKDTAEEAKDAFLRGDIVRLGDIGFQMVDPSLPTTRALNVVGAFFGDADAGSRGRDVFIGNNVKGTSTAAAVVRANMDPVSRLYAGIESIKEMLR